MNRKRTGRTGKIVSILLAVIVLWCGRAVPAAAAGDIQYRMNVKVFVDGAQKGSVPAFDDNYENNLYVSLKGIAHALSGTGKAFEPTIENRTIGISTGTDFLEEASVWTKEELAVNGWSVPSLNKIYVDGAEKKYYSFIQSRDGAFDAFLTPVSLAMLLDMNIEVTQKGVEIHTSEPFRASAPALEESGYLQGVNALVIGDATTGEIYYRYDADTPFAIASTTKLMTYFVFMDAVTQGECSLSDAVVISEKAARLSASPDGEVPLRAGARIPVTELLYGMLLPSSNECALAIAEHVAGSEEAFVERMQERADGLGLADTKFYNCHGLPYYEDQLMPAKMQNRMTAEEMFRLASAIVNTYPQVTEFTSAKKYNLGTIGMEVKNTNAMLYNMENAVGLKTGTTNRAGACLVTCLKEEKDGETHCLITVLFGADGDASRGIVSEISARYAADVLQRGKTGEEENADSGEGIPSDPEAVVERLIGTALLGGNEG